MINLMKVMADNRLDAIVHKSVEHQPTLIKDGMNPPYPTKQRYSDSEHFSCLCPVHYGAVGIHHRQPADRDHFSGRSL